MADVIRLVCPECNPSKDTRIKELETVIAPWVYHKNLWKLLSCFGVTLPAGGSLREDIDNLWKAIQIWDFRRGRERWTIPKDDPRILEHAELIDRTVCELGFLNTTDTVIEQPDYILPVGGARMTNYNTPRKARMLLEEHDLRGVTVVGISAFRPRTERDEPQFAAYADHAETEFHALCGGLVKVFALDGTYTVQSNDNEDPRRRSEVRIYRERFCDGTIAAIGAPSSEPDKRRANTLDSFLYFLNTFEVPENSRIILTTNSMYVPFQLMRLMNTALQRNLMIDCVGVQSWDRVSDGEYSLYLQEIKATVDGMHDLLCC